MAQNSIADAKSAIGLLVVEKPSRETRRFKKLPKSVAYVHTTGSPVSKCLSNIVIASPCGCHACADE